MKYFNIESCNVSACRYWRMGNKCAKDQFSIARTIQFIPNLHSDELCQVRHQMNVYRLNYLLEN